MFNMFHCCEIILFSLLSDHSFRHNKDMKTDYKLHPFFSESFTVQRSCDHVGCHQIGKYRAPVSPLQLNDYYWFCLDHVRDYNLNWNYYQQMSADEMERSRREDETWQRPTWTFGQKLDYRTSGVYDYFDLMGNEQRQKTKVDSNIFSEHSPEYKAMALFALEYPYNIAQLKKRYKHLAKQYHPDLNGNCPKAEEIFKQINQAYAVLKKLIK